MTLCVKSPLMKTSSLFIVIAQLTTLAHAALPPTETHFKAKEVRGARDCELTVRREHDTRSTYLIVRSESEKVEFQYGPIPNSKLPLQEGIVYEKFSELQHTGANVLTTYSKSQLKMVADESYSGGYQRSETYRFDINPTFTEVQRVEIQSYERQANSVQKHHLICEF